MHPLGRVSHVLLIRLVLVCATGLSLGCNKQGEGDRCDVKAGGYPAGTNDCQQPLVCTRFTDTLSRCCPPTGDTVTAAVCVIPTGTLSSGAPPSSDASSDWTDATLEAGDDGSTADAASGDDGSAADSASGDDATDAEAATGVDAGDGGDAAEDVGTSE